MPVTVFFRLQLYSGGIDAAEAFVKKARRPPCISFEKMLSAHTARLL
jgi:hypothetical protein